MAVGDELVNVSATVIQDIGTIGRWMEAIGIAVVLWIIFQVVGYVLSRKRMKEISQIKQDMVRIEGKIDALLEGKRKK